MWLQSWHSFHFPQIKILSVHTSWCSSDCTKNTAIADYMLIYESLSVIVISPAHKLLNSPSKRYSLFYMEIQ